jgi:PEP-CTERM motif
MVQLFADSMGMTLTRVDDDGDQSWIASSNSGVFGLARSASRDFELGLIPGDSGNLGGYVSLLSPIGSAGSPTVILPTIPAGQNANGDLHTSASYVANGGAGPALLPSFTAIPVADQGSNMRFAIQQVAGTDLWTSNPNDNRDATDHMVTWQLNSSYLTNNNLVWYVVGFENAVFPGSDKDYNDYAFVFQNAVTTSAVPEPGSLLLVGAGVLCLFIGRIRRVRRS